MYSKKKKKKRKEQREKKKSEKRISENPTTRKIKTDYISYIYILHKKTLHTQKSKKKTKTKTYLFLRYCS